MKKRTIKFWTPQEEKIALETLREYNGNIAKASKELAKTLKRGIKGVQLRLYGLKKGKKFGTKRIKTNEVNVQLSENTEITITPKKVIITKEYIKIFF